MTAGPLNWRFYAKNERGKVLIPYQPGPTCSFTFINGVTQIGGARGCSEAIPLRRSCSSHIAYKHCHLSVLLFFPVGVRMFGVGSAVSNLHGFGTFSSCRDLTLSSSSPTKIPYSSPDEVLILPHHQSKQGENSSYWIG